jgi:hypothetical protein
LQKEIGPKIYGFRKERRRKDASLTYRTLKNHISDFPEENIVTGKLIIMVCSMIFMSKRGKGTIHPQKKGPEFKKHYGRSPRVMTSQEKQVLGKTNRLLILIRHGPQ